MYTSSDAKYCEISVTDDVVGEPGMISQPGPACQDKHHDKYQDSCCGGRLKSYFLLDLDLSNKRCPQYTFSVRCYTYLHLSQGTEEQLRSQLATSQLTLELDALSQRNQNFEVFLISDWSQTMQTDFGCQKVIGLDHEYFFPFLSIVCLRYWKNCCYRCWYSCSYIYYCLGYSYRCILL